MTLRPGGSFPMARRAVHRRQRGALQTQQLNWFYASRSATASGSLSGTNFNPNAPFSLFGSYISAPRATAAPAGSALSPRSQKAAKALKPSSGGG